MLIGRSRRKRGATAEGPAHRGDPDEYVHLDGDDNAWWSQREVTRPWSPPPKLHPVEDRDVLADHFGDDWRTNFGISTPLEEPAPAPPKLELVDNDPYSVLQVEPTATWDEIVAAHRGQARANHPDQLFGQSDDAQAEGEDRIRAINAAYRELKVRRGR